MKKEIKLYNVMFPIWFLWLFPETWIFVLPANFFIDLLVLVLVMKHLNITDIRRRAGKSILRVWLLGFAADFVGGFFMLLASLMEYDQNTALGNWLYENLTNSVMFNPFENIAAFLWVTVCTLLSGALIYLFNVKFCLRKAELSEEHRRKVALAMAVFTAPYLFYFPSILLYR
ncbi:MAG: hypothetical protein KH452_00225 [Clostridiales bacterium]|nr:hypothetical protein [Clostridiales bacterium]